MPVAIVDLFEPVDVEQHQREAMAVPAARRSALGQRVLQDVAVGQPGERIGAGQALELGCWRR